MISTHNLGMCHFYHVRAGQEFRLGTFAYKYVALENLGHKMGPCNHGKRKVEQIMHNLPSFSTIVLTIHQTYYDH